MISLKQLIRKHFGLEIKLVNDVMQFMYCPNCERTTAQRYQGWDGKIINPTYNYKCMVCKKTVESKIRK